MLTVKFYGSSQNTFSCHSYQVFKRDNGSISIVVHSSKFQEDGIDINLSNNKDEKYSQCFVENLSGKTIDSFKATDEA